MQSVVTTPFAIFLELNSVRVVLLIFLGRVVAPFALCARQSYHCSHELLLKNLNLVHLHSKFHIYILLLKMLRGQKLSALIKSNLFLNYLMILVTLPDPTVLPPSRIANFRPSSIATG